MNPWHALTSVTERDTEDVYGVFDAAEDNTILMAESVFSDKLIYIILKLDSTNDDGIISNDPICSLYYPQFPYSMFFFNLDSKLYLCGGHKLDGGRRVFQTTTYMIDFSHENKCIKKIGEMNSAMRYPPLVFGPNEDKCFFIYCFTTFEMFNTLTNKWITMELPRTLCGHFRYTSVYCCGSNVLFSSSSEYWLMHVFNTKTLAWRTLTSDEIPPFLPFGSHSLFSENNKAHISLNNLCSGDLAVYWSPKVKGDELVPPKSGGVQCLDLGDYLKKPMPNFFDNFHNCVTYNKDLFRINDKSICIVRYEEEGPRSHENFVFNIFELNCSLLDGSPTIKVKKSLQLQLHYEHVYLEPQHFFSAP